jgi:hypothetical protein
MLIVATFKHSAYLELALKQMEQKGISKHDMIVAPLTKQSEITDELDWKLIHQNGKSQYDNIFIFATIFMLLGAIYGFVLAWGPIIWAIIGIIIGGFFGFLVDYFIRKKAPKNIDNNSSEIVLMVQCNTQQIESIDKILWNHQAIGISKVNSYPYTNTLKN